MIACLNHPLTAEKYPEVKYGLWTYAPTEYFQRILEYFGWPELTANKVIVRSDPAQRAGLYFILEMNKSLSSYPPNSAIILHYFLPKKPWPLKKRFAIPKSIDAESELWIGLTGSDSPLQYIDHTIPIVDMTSGQKHYPVKYSPLAWKVEIIDSQGTILTEYQSFLWSIPPDAGIPHKKGTNMSDSNHTDINEIKKKKDYS